MIFRRKPKCKHDWVDGMTVMVCQKCSAVADSQSGSEMVAVIGWSGAAELRDRH